MSYPTLELASDPNLFRVLTHSSLMQPAYQGINFPVADTCTTRCGSDGLPHLFQRMGQRRACCAAADAMSHAPCAPMSQNPRFPGHNLPAFEQTPVDNLSGHFCGYARNARYVGTLGGAGYG